MRYFLLGLALTSSAAVAAETPETIVVTATRTEQPLSRVGQSVSVIDASRISSRQSISVAELLQDLPSVSLARNGGTGALTSVFVRGASADQTIVLIDGVKLNDPSSTAGGFFFGDLLAGNIARIEVLRGAQSVLWGSQSIGGVVNLITRPPTETLRVNARAEYGWRDTTNVVGNISGKVGPVAASIGGGYMRTDGISAFSEARGGTERDGYRNAGANAKFEIALSDAVSVDLRGWYVSGRTEEDGFPPPIFTFADNDQFTRNRQLVGYAGLNAALFDGRLHNRLAFAYTDVRRRTFDPDASPVERLSYRGRNERLEYQGILDLRSGWQLSFGAERETQRFGKTEVYDPAGHRGSAHTTSVYAQLVATPVRGLTLTGGSRYDHHSDFGGHVTFGASGAWTPDEGVTTVRASYAEGFKAPSLYQLASEYGNPGLDPETARGWDAGVTRRFLDGAIEAGITYFRRRTGNLIDFAFCPGNPVCADGRYGYYKNIARTAAHGIEASLLLRPREGLTVETNLSTMRAQDRSAGSADYGKQLVRRPRHSLSTAIDYRWPFGLETGATTRLVSARRDVDYDLWPAQDVRLASYVVVDLRVRYPLTGMLELYGRIENLFDERYETVLRYGTPGRAAFAGVRLKM